MDGNDQNPEAWHSLADKLIDNHGLGLYFGYEGSDGKGYRAGTDLLRSLLMGRSVGCAYSRLDNNLKVEYDRGERAELKWYPNTGKEDMFLVQTYTEPVDLAYAKVDFLKDKYVVVKGTTTTSDINAIKMGFVYGTDESLASGTLVTNVKKNKLAQPTDKGNTVFNAALLDLDPGITYYYMAYTSDGYNVNYSAPCSFFISICPDDNHPHMIDLGLSSGTKWACCNVGASKPEDYGGYYAWGEILVKSDYYWDNYFDTKNYVFQNNL